MNSKLGRVAPNPAATFRHRPCRLACCVALLLGLGFAGCGQSAVLNGEEARQAADALYTAVTGKRPDLLIACRKQIGELKSSGKMSDAGAQELLQVIDQADRGEWRPAAERLDVIIRAES
ncbi:MAG TPA: hypothetical protein VM452_06850 [Caulifigura sp.]|nr:hypothetical protein [Caulifigura sp.]